MLESEETVEKALMQSDPSNVPFENSSPLLLQLRWNEEKEPDRLPVAVDSYW